DHAGGEVVGPHLGERSPDLADRGAYCVDHVHGCASGGGCCVHETPSPIRRRRTGNSWSGRRFSSRPCRPVGATIAMIAASAPSTMKRHVSASSSSRSSSQYTPTPKIGPAVEPTPPITTMKITSAVQSATENAESERVEVVLSRITAPVHPVQNAATTQTS